MKLSQTPELLNFLSTSILNAEMSPEGDEQATRAFAEKSNSSTQKDLLQEAKRLLEDAEFPVDEFGAEANRWFADADEGRTWLKRIVEILESAGSSESGGITVKDSNGTPLSEGDSVLVIKDLKVKGGSSDLKRGTMIKKIHLIDDPANIECRVDGSTLVLKTIFLKKV